jgi:hypothetical protein
VQNEGYKLFLAKNRDYGNAFERHGVIGCLIRIGDKLNRLQTVTNNSIHYVEDERIEDTLIDLANYATLALALRKADKSHSQKGDKLAYNALRDELLHRKS